MAAVDYLRLTEVLRYGTNDEGMLLPWRIRERAASLDEQLATLAAAGPTATPGQFPTSEFRLAYWYNARTAWAVRLAMANDFPDEMPAAELRDRRVPLDGREMTFAEIGQEILQAGDWQAVVAAPCVCMQGARLPREAFAPGDIRRVIRERFNEFIADRQRFVIDVENRRVLVPPSLWPFADQLIAQYNSTYHTTGATLVTALLPHTTGQAQRRLQDAIGYAAVPAAANLKLAKAK